MTPEEKFETCDFRSTEKHIYSTGRCCGSREKEGYLCFKINIEDVTPEICANCIYYKPKENV